MCIGQPIHMGMEPQQFLYCMGQPEVQVSSDGAENSLMRSRPGGFSAGGWTREVNKGLYTESDILEEEHLEFKGTRKAGDDLQLGGVDGAMWVRPVVGSS